MILVLGGTAEARALAAATPVLSSLAGRVSNPRLPEGATRIGGFGGAAGLACFLRDEGITAVVDATHPFAAQISANASVACAQVGVPLLRLQRPGWSDLPQAARWTWVDSHEQAAAAVRGRVFLTTGRQSLHHFAGLPEVVARVVEPADIPEGWTLLLDRGPYTFEGELALLSELEVQTLITKDSGGGYTRPKLDAADALGLDVVVVRRPPAPQGVETVSSVDEVLQWLHRRGDT